jgi:hypothetical protein
LCARADHRRRRCPPDDLSVQSEGRGNERLPGRVAVPIADDQQVRAGGDLVLSDSLPGTQRLAAIIGGQSIGLVDRLGRTGGGTRDLGRYVLEIIINTEVEHAQCNACCRAVTVGTGDPRQRLGPSSA